MRRATRTYHRLESTPIPGLGQGKTINVTSFTDHRPIRFRVNGKPPTDDFLLHHGTWHELGEPDRIRVTVEAA